MGRGVWVGPPKAAPTRGRGVWVKRTKRQWPPRGLWGASPRGSLDVSRRRLQSQARLAKTRLLAVRRHHGGRLLARRLASSPVDTNTRPGIFGGLWNLSTVLIFSLPKGLQSWVKQVPNFKRGRDAELVDAFAPPPRRYGGVTGVTADEIDIHFGWNERILRCRSITRRCLFGRE